MKSIKYIWTLCLAALSVGFSACNEDDEYFDSKYQDTPIVINKIYLEDAESSVPDRLVEFARLGQMIRVEGSGLMGMKKVYINGYDTYFNRAYVSDNSMLIQINSKTPVVDAEPEERDIIRFVKDNTETAYNFTIRAASPSVSGINTTLPMPGEIVIVSGTNLHETSSVTLPDGTQVTNITNDEDGEWYSFVMPEGVSETGGSILSEGAHGSAKSPACFNERRGIILDFDGTGVQGGWSATYTSDDLTTDPLETGRGNVVSAIPASALEEGGIQSGANGKGWFTAGGEKGAWSDATENWTRFYDLIPAETPVSNIALQFDVYVPEPWSTGMLEFTFQNNLSSYGYGSTETKNTTNIAYPTAVLWIPWLVDGEVVPYQSEGWTTITIPISSVGKYQDTESAYTFADVVADRAVASYANFGMFFVNGDVVDEELGYNFAATAFNQNIYVDNWRLVPFETFIISDYPEDDAE
ncbi:MAG: hypothetical protein IJ511_01615 [Bacteroides sp.]|nr:hypothetical protein [Bacteroides sp.]